MATHAHEFQGQTLVHDHQGGELPHGYFEHPEDGSRATETRSTTPMADALAKADAETENHYSALCELAEAVRLSLAEFSEGDVRTLAAMALELRDYTDDMSRDMREALSRAAKAFGTASA